MLDHAPSPQRLRDIAAALDGLELGVTGDTMAVLLQRATVASRDYLAPRLEDPSSPLLVLVAGPGGGGKSTIVNSLAQHRVTPTGPVRPTTTEPVVWAGEELPTSVDIVRDRHSGSIGDAARLPPAGVVLVDAPPPDVIGADGRPVVHGLLSIVDVLVFVTGVTRYADAEGFAVLDAADDRGLPIVTVLNRLPQGPEIQQLVAADFASKLADRRLLPRSDPELIVTVAESDVSQETEALAPEEVARVRKEVESIADPQSRPDVVQSAVSGTLRRLRTDLAAIRAGLIDHEVLRVELIDRMRAIYRDEGRRLAGEAKRGSFAGEDDPLATMAAAAARRAGLAARATAETWAEIAPGLIDSHPALFAPAPGIVPSARERLEFWRDEIEPLIERRATRSLSRRRRRRLARHVRAAALDPRAEPDRAARRSLRRVPGVVDAARELLGEEMRGIVDADSRRFETLVGPAVPGGILAELSGVGVDE